MGQVCDAWTQHGGGPTAHPRSSRSSTTAVEAARAAMASQPTWLAAEAFAWLAAEAFAARALHHTNLLRKLLRNARLVHNTSHRAGSASANGASVRCMDEALRGADGSSTHLGDVVTDFPLIANRSKVQREIGQTMPAMSRGSVGDQSRRIAISNADIAGTGTHH